jgi:hypothetical protein
MTIIGVFLLVLFVGGFIAAVLKWGPPTVEAHKSGAGRCCNRPPGLPSSARPPQNERKS